MECVPATEARYEVAGSSSDVTSSVYETSSSDQLSEDLDSSDDEDNLKEDLQKTIPECYKSDSNFTSHTSSDITNEEFQATALCQFMDILNDLDEVLDKSLLACLDDTVAANSFDSDEEDLICKIKECIGPSTSEQTPLAHTSLDDNTQVICAIKPASNSEDGSERLPNTLGRSKSFSDLSESHRQTIPNLERSAGTTENLRTSMRRLDPIVLPAISQDVALEPLTLPVILFLEHHVNMRPTSAPIQLQVTAANLSSDGASGPLIVGRRALLMNRAVSLPSPVDSDVTGDWTGRNTARSSTSSSSNETLAGALPANANQTPVGLSEERVEDTCDEPAVWPHRLSAMLACLGCTVGVFNISRFAIFSVHFGAGFIVQFFILSLLIGIPLFLLYMCLGQFLEAGPVDMWKISPIFQGVGICFLISQALIGIYSIVGLSWIFVYFRDAFINADDKYKWGLPHEYNSDDGVQNGSFRLEDTLAQYFHGEVLQKNLGAHTSGSYFGTIKFQVAFNLAVVWMIVFVALSKGLRSYGKAIYMLMFLPICGSLVLCTKLLTLIPYDAVTNIFSDTDWAEFFVNTNSWAAAAQETFLTWGLFGVCVMQISSHKGRGLATKTPSTLQKESLCIVAFTFAILLLASFLANTCVLILKSHGYRYTHGSYESVQSSHFIHPLTPSAPIPAPLRYLPHYGSLVGVTVTPPAPTRAPAGWHGHSGWQPLALATQLVPGTLAVLAPDELSPAWAVIFYFILIMFGLAQQLAIWHCVITGIMAIDAKALKIWETTITFLSCVFGLAMGLLLSTDASVRLVHFLDVCAVGGWWQGGACLALIAAVWVVRGRPVAPDAVAAVLTRTPHALAAFWAVLMPVLLCAICVVDFRIGQQRQFYSWKKPIGYWPTWARQLAVLIQQGCLLMMPAAALVQTWRYMSKGPADILERIQNLYRPAMSPSPPPLPPLPACRRPLPPPAPTPDPPPKYTPPPSYSTATGARLLNTLRRSFRNLRRITTSRPESQPDEAGRAPVTLSEAVDTQPPAYNFPTLTLTHETDSRPRHSLSLTREYLRRSFVRKSDSAKSIRSSLRRSFKFGGLTTSHEQLVRTAAPMASSVAMTAILDGEQERARSVASVI